MSLRRYTAASFLTLAGLLLGLSPASGEDLSIKRDGCQTEARKQIKSSKGTGARLYGVARGARQSYVLKCMAREKVEPAPSRSAEPLPAPIVRPKTATVPAKRPRQR